MNRRVIGNKGEDIACTFLKKEGFVIVDRNYFKKWGELDIVAEKDNIIHFCEVKSVIVNSVDEMNGHRPEDNVHGLKTRRLRRIIETYLEEKGGGLGREFQFHVICVYMNISSHRASVKWLKNIII
jgi:putative endonuclease